MRRLLLVLMVMALVVAACGGGDDSSLQGDAVETGGDGSGATASVRVGGNSYEFSGATDCFPDGPAGVAIRFDHGDDFVSLNQAGDITLVRARLEGTEYADNGSPDSPVVSGSNVTWSGEMGGDGETYDVQMSFGC